MGTFSDASELLDTIMEMLKEGGQNMREEQITAASTPEALADLYSLYMRRHSFQPGDLVTWKPGLDNRVLPQAGHPAIVIEMLPGERGEYTPEPTFPHTDSEPLDIRLALVTPNNHLFFVVDSRRLQLWTPPK